MTAFHYCKFANGIAYLRDAAVQKHCILFFESMVLDVLAMNKTGKDEILYCLCKVNTPCPCPESEKEIRADGKCYCGIFREVI